MKIVSYLNVIFNLNDGTYKSYTKPNNEIKYLHKDPNHPPTVILQIPLFIESMSSTLSYHEKIFVPILPPSQKVLQNSGYQQTFNYKVSNKDNNPVDINKTKRNMKQQIIRFNLLFNVKIKKKSTNRS